MPQATRTKFAEWGSDLLLSCQLVHMGVTYQERNDSKFLVTRYLGEVYLVSTLVDVLWHALGNWTYEAESTYDACVRELISATITEYQKALDNEP